VTLATPLALLGLAALPVGGLLYARAQRRRAGQRRAFVAAALAASVAPRSPRWRRHAPMVAFAVALAALIVALAGPRTSAALTVRRSTVVLACDVSASMAATDVKPSRLAAVERAARRFLARSPREVSIGVIAFDQSPSVLLAPTRDRAAIRGALRGWRAHGGTAIGTAIAASLALVGGSGTRRARAPAAIVLISDGGSTSGANPIAQARRAARHHVPIYTVALGTPHGTISVAGPDHTRHTVPARPDPRLLGRIATLSRGQHFTARSAGRLHAIYARLGAKLGHRKITRSLTASFAGGALALIALGGGLSLLWFGRPI
jgi:Ca-activated chloride channel homolog